MKFLVAVALFAIIACVAAEEESKLKLTEEQKGRVHEYAKECGEKLEVSKDQIKELKNGKFENVDDKVKSFINCFLEKVGFIVDGVPQTETVKTKLAPLIGEEELKTVIEKCNGLKGENNNDTAFQVYKCYYEQHASYL